jgi:prolyl oligopeptidase
MMRLSGFRAACLLAALLPAACTTPPETHEEAVPAAPVVPVKLPFQPPSAQPRPVIDTYHGIAVADPYRYFEDLKDPAVTDFMKAQSGYALRMLERIPGRAELLKRIEALSDAGVVIGDVQMAGNRFFYLKLSPGEATRRLYVRDGLTDAERLLVDPAKVGPEGQQYTLDYFRPSPGGRHVVYGVSADGDENSVLRVVETAKGNDLGIVIEGARYGEAVHWFPDGKSFFYNKLPSVRDGAPPGYVDSRAYRHVLGKNPARDTALFGKGVNTSIDLAATDIPEIAIPHAARYALAVVRHGDAREISLYSVAVSALLDNIVPWKKIAGRNDEVTDFTALGDDLYLLTHKNAPRFKVVRTTLSQADLSRAATVVAQSDAVVKEMVVAADGLYIRQLNGGSDQLYRLNFNSRRFPAGKLEFIRLPLDVSIRAMVADPARAGVMLRIESWTEAPRYAVIEERTGNLIETKLLPRHGADFSAYDEVRLLATARDGVKIPVSMIYPKGTMLSHDHPVLLTGYGAYGITMRPYFQATRLAWLERGGIFATCHVRGGGEYGEAWHEGGRKATKNNTIDDFIACAEFLIERGFTRPDRLAAMGGSAGGITVGNALVRRPALFAAVVGRVGVFDMLRMETTPNGQPNIEEFGSTATPEGFKWLYETSAFHNVREITAYPGVLLTTGANDPRVEPWNALKFAARLQDATTSPAEKKPVLLRVDYGAGHSANVSRSSSNEELADIYAFLFWQLGVTGFLPEAGK